MQIKREAVCALLVLFFLCAGVLMVPTVKAVQDIESDNGSTPAADYNFANRESPISILLYTEYADMAETVNGEYANTNKSIRDGYGQRYVKDNLDDYTQLGEMIDDYDVFIIVEQEDANQSVIADVSSAWSGFLGSWVGEGGILICMGYWESELGVTHGLLNNTGLMELYDPVDRAYASVDVVLANHSLAFGVPSPFAGPDGTVGYTTTDGNIVCESGGNAVVVDKPMGQGHVVMLGFDLFDYNSNATSILTNAIRLTKHVVFDASNEGTYDPLNGFVEFASTLSSWGFAISTMESFDEELIASCDIVVAPAGDLEGYSSSEIDVLEAFVAGGGGMMVTADWGTFGDNTDPLLERFGFVRNSNPQVIQDSDEYEGLPGQVHYNLANMANHSATFHTAQVQLFYSTAFNETPAEAVPLIWTDSDGTESWSGSSDSAAGLTLAASLLYGDGRIMALADGDFLCDDDYDMDAITDFYDQDNEVFAVNMMCWLLAAGLPEKTLLVDNSHGAYQPISYSDWFEFGRFLTMNGFSLMWMNHFSEELMDMADALLLLSGTVAYMPSEISVIVDFVSRGGGFFAIGDQLVYSTELTNVTSEFGIAYNSINGSIWEDDDYDTYNRYLIYDNDNFVNHPIMSGVDKLEFDLTTGFSQIGVGTALVVTDDDGTAHWYNMGITGEATAVPLAVATEFNLGRVVAIADYNMPTNTDPDGDTFHTLFDSDNAVFLANAFYWLIENRAPIVEVVFPNGGEVLNETEVIEWTAVDPNRDELTFDIYYSDNNGSDWSLLTGGLSGLTYSWNTSLHDDGDSYLIRVVAFDGYVDVSDESDATFELDNYV
ncbi:hypothetical protein EU546_04600, partial [Candidatus Thorarchaeota archaeon]